MKDVLKKSMWCRNNLCAVLPYSFILYRRKFVIAKSEKLDIAVSADCRYNLYLDGKFIGRGPLRGDLEHYNYERYTFEIAAGEHVLSAEVINYTDRFYAPWAEVHYEHAFLCAGNCGEINLSTPGSWKSAIDHSRKLKQPTCKGNIPIGQMENFQPSLCNINWKNIDFCDNLWDDVEAIAAPTFHIGNDDDPSSRWKLVENKLPQLAQELIKNISIVKSENAEFSIYNNKFSIILKAAKGHLIIDLGKYYTHLPSFEFAENKEVKGTLRIAYAESLYNKDGKKSYRSPFADGVIGRNAYGDIVNFSGDLPQVIYRPMFWRSGRYIELEFDLDKDVKIENCRFEFISFPFEQNFNFNTIKDPFQRKIAEISWHTARCCAHEHYEDCPYYEQMQYIGDTRIQALISYTIANEGRLGKQAIEQFDQSRIASGLPMSRYPSNFRQIIPGFSLFWIMMIDDYFRYFNDSEIIRKHWQGINDVLNHFEAVRNSDGLIGYPGEWNFSDWVQGWVQGKSNRGTTETETLFNLLYAQSCRISANLAQVIGENAEVYLKRYEMTKKAVNANCFNSARGLYTDVPNREYFSQHTNAWAILSGVTDKAREDKIINAILFDDSLSQCSLYFSFYLLELMTKMNNMEGFNLILKKWEKFIDYGFTTFPECLELSCRSDCHAWSAGPLVFLSGRFK